MKKEDYNTKIEYAEEKENQAYDLLGKDKVKSRRLLLDVYDTFVKAGDLYLEGGNIQKAIFAYDSAAKNTPYPGLKENMYRKISTIKKSYNSKKTSQKQKSSSLLEKLTLTGKEVGKEVDNIFKKFGLAFLSVFCFVLTLLFLTPILSGNAINNSKINDYSILGVCFFVCGLVFSFLFLKDKK